MKGFLRRAAKRIARPVEVPLVAAVLVSLAVVLLGVIIWSIKRSPSIELHVEDPGELHVLIPSLVSLSQGSLDPGNSVQVLQNGDQFFPAVMREIAGAKQSVHFETFIWYDGLIARQFAQLLQKKAREGVAVRLLVDGSGGRQLEGDVLDALKASGAKVAHFHPVRISNLGRLNNRDHRKLMIVDGRVAFIGGFGIADSWSGNAQDRKHFRDTGLRVTGPVVHRLQAAFAENWIEETGEIPAGESYFPLLQPTGPSPAHVAYTSPSGGVSAVQVLHYLAIAAARREILIQNPYLLPDDDVVDAIAAATKRGVDVRFMVPSANATDAAIVQHASHHSFGSLLKAGARIYEYEKTLLHQKVIIVDGIWSAVGSTNFDDRSFQINDEVTIGVLDRSVAAQLRNAFVDDLRYARERKLDEWKKRPLWHKAIDGVAHLGGGQF